MPNNAKKREQRAPRDPEFVTIERTASTLRVMYRPMSGVIFAFTAAGIGVVSSYLLMRADGYLAGLLPFAIGVTFLILGINVLWSKCTFEVSAGSMKVQGRRSGVFSGEGLQKIVASLQTGSSEFCQLKAIYKDQKTEVLAEKIQHMETAKYIARLLEEELLKTNAES